MQMNPDLEKFIEYVIEKNASDLHLSSNNRPIVRIAGQLTNVPDTKAIDNVELVERLFNFFVKLDPISEPATIKELQYTSSASMVFKPVEVILYNNLEK